MTSANDVPRNGAGAEYVDREWQPPIACLTCSDRGWVIGGDALQSCPSCHGAWECGECGRMAPAAETTLLDAGTYKWRRCDRCRDRDRAMVAEQDRADFEGKQVAL